MDDPGSLMRLWSNLCLLVLVAVPFSLYGTDADAAGKSGHAG